MHIEYCKPWVLLKAHAGILKYKDDINYSQAKGFQPTPLPKNL